MNANENKPIVRKTVYSIVIKRFLDIIMSGTLIICLSWLFMGIIFLEFIFHGRPIFYCQKRPGKEGVVFNLYKFRSMTNETDEKGALLPGEERVTKFGRFIRKFSLDELPELFCIFTGKMSFIGPRPLLPEYLDIYTERHKMRHAVRPGLACLPPRKKVSSWTWNDQFENDIFYIENISFKIDIMIFVSVIREALCGSEYRVNDTRQPLEKDYWKK